MSPRFVREVELASSPPRGIHRQTAQSVDVCYQRPSRVTYAIWTRVGHLGPYLSVPRPGIITKYVAAPFAPEETSLCSLANAASPNSVGAGIKDTIGISSCKRRLTTAGTRNAGEIGIFTTHTLAGFAKVQCTPGDMTSGVITHAGRFDYRSIIGGPLR